MKKKKKAVTIILIVFILIFGFIFGGYFAIKTVMTKVQLTIYKTNIRCHIIK